jgi:hypothetical protein
VFALLALTALLLVLVGGGAIGIYFMVGRQAHPGGVPGVTDPPGPGEAGLDYAAVGAGGNYKNYSRVQVGMTRSA